MITVKNIFKTYGKGEAAARALREVSFTISKGEMVSITGPSGCGKSTLLHILAGIESIDNGEIWIGDAPIHTWDDKKIAKLRLARMGFVFQSYHLIPVLSAWENTALPLIAAGIPANQAKARALEALKEVGLADKALHYPSVLSGGQNQRVAIARAIVGKPDIIWADEPTGALDTDTAEQIIGMLEMLNRHHGTTIVIVTHDPRIASRTTRAIRLQNGRVIHDGGVAL
ncbi:macrolide ABC transporter ATP-binding protein [Paenibacillus sp. FSL H8-0548]|uniref:ABC transporter ATP-binding protein n=1 Tax=Paenibacillus sp. FSL H8-0548 TaxID=1920422 RepID=UPI00096C5CC4|nr:ABC transporter ATP-binding protein [Paenibacillus sp. FSL H8-0548]OMF37811.1 macrolide ABC transporter ATP-binding protein [Paenibacillus sp. FSL H8-0548]